MWSEKEQLLFKALGVEWITAYNTSDLLVGYSGYKIAMEEVFIKNMQGPAVESLRRCLKAIKECKVYRMTPEWDALIELE